MIAFLPAVVLGPFGIPNNWPCLLDEILAGTFAFVRAEVIGWKLSNLSWQYCEILEFGDRHSLFLQFFHVSPALCGVTVMFYRFSSPLLHYAAPYRRRGTFFLFNLAVPTKFREYFRQQCSRNRRPGFFLRSLSCSTSLGLSFHSFSFSFISCFLSYLSFRAPLSIRHSVI